METLLLEIHYIAYNRFCKNWFVKPRVLTDYEIIYILSGSGTITANGKKLSFKAGQFILIPPGMSHTLHSLELPLSLWCIHFFPFTQLTDILMPHQVDEDGTFINGLLFPNRDSQLELRPYKIPMPIVSSPKNQISIVLAQKICQLMQNHITENVSHIQLLLEGILKNNITGFEKSSHSTISRIQEYIETHYAEKITLTQLAEIFYLDASYLSTLFKKNIGVTITDYIRSCRINAVKSYLSYTEESLESIAEKTGFFDSAHLCRTFYQKEGITPIHYRKFAQGNQT